MGTSSWWGTQIAALNILFNFGQEWVDSSTDQCQCTAKIWPVWVKRACIWAPVLDLMGMREPLFIGMHNETSDVVGNGQNEMEIYLKAAWDLVQICMYDSNRGTWARAPISNNQSCHKNPITGTVDKGAWINATIMFYVSTMSKFCIPFRWAKHHVCWGLLQMCKNTALLCTHRSTALS